MEGTPGRSAVDDAKVELRPHLLGARREIVSGRDRDADDHALARQVESLVDELGLGAGATVAAYEAMRTEPPTAATMAALSARGIRVIVPITLSDNDLDWREATDDSRMPVGPDAISAAALVLTPGLAVDHVGTRLGRGGGSYDRALSRRGRDCRVVVVLHPGELHAVRLPRDAHDEPVDGMITVDGLVWF